MTDVLEVPVVETGIIEKKKVGRGRTSRLRPGVTTMVGTRLRIVNGDVESLRRFPKKNGRPKKVEPVAGTPEYLNIGDFTDAGIALQDQFRLVRHRAHRDEVTKQHKNLQDRFDALASDVVEGKTFESLGSVSRIEQAVPGENMGLAGSKGFCSCRANKTDSEMPCIVHGLKRDDCGCGGTHKIFGTGICGGHRNTAHTPGVRPFPETERMKAAREAADQVAREIGWI